MAAVLEWLQDNWVALLVGALVTAIIASIQVWWQRQTKRLEYDVRNRLPLIAPAARSATRGLAKELAVFYGDSKVSNPYLLTVRIRNIGKLYIEEDDYVEGIQLTGERQQPFDGFVSASIPQDLRVAQDNRLFDPDRNQLLPLKPPLLQPGEWFDLQLLCDGHPGKISATCRVKGMQRPIRDAAAKKASGMRETGRHLFIGTALGLIIAGVLAMLPTHLALFVLNSLFFLAVATVPLYAVARLVAIAIRRRR